MGRNTGASQARLGGVRAIDPLREGSGKRRASALVCVTRARCKSSAMANSTRGRGAIFEALEDVLKPGITILDDPAGQPPSLPHNAFFLRQPLGCCEAASRSRLPCSPPAARRACGIACCATYKPRSSELTRKGDRRLCLYDEPRALGAKRQPAPFKGSFNGPLLLEEGRTATGISPDGWRAYPARRILRGLRATSVLHPNYRPPRPQPVEAP